jgi:cysteine desulfuration protein SufE
MVDELNSVEDLTDKYEILIDLGKKVPEIPDPEKNERNFIRGCQSVVHVYGGLEEGKMQFHGHADALVVNGLLALLVLGLSGLSPEEFLAVSPDFIKQTGVVKTLTPSRVNGFYNIHQAMKHLAEQARLASGKAS